MDMEEQIQEISGEVSRLTGEVSSISRQLMDMLPEITRFGLKVVCAILVFIAGRVVIRWILKVMKRSMERGSVDKGVIQFVGSTVSPHVLR